MYILFTVSSSYSLPEHVHYEARREVETENDNESKNNEKIRIEGGEEGMGEEREREVGGGET